MDMTERMGLLVPTKKKMAKKMAKVIPFDTKRAQKRGRGCHNAFCMHSRGCLCRCAACSSCMKGVVVP